MFDNQLRSLSEHQPNAVNRDRSITGSRGRGVRHRQLGTCTPQYHGALKTHTRAQDGRSGGFRVCPSRPKTDLLYNPKS